LFNIQIDINDSNSQLSTESSSKLTNGGQLNDQNSNHFNHHHSNNNNNNKNHNNKNHKSLQNDQNSKALAFHNNAPKTQGKYINFIFIFFSFLYFVRYSILKSNIIY
jgi:ATP-dependent Zn protease